MKRFLSVLIVLATALTAVAQTTVKVQAPNLVAVDEQFNVSFVISGEDAPSAFEWQPTDDFQLVWGPQKGTSSSVTIINGQRTKSSQTSYTYILLPRKTGNFTLPAAVATVKGERVTSSAATIEVVSGGSKPAGGQQAQESAEAQSRAQQQSGTVAADDIFLRMSVSKTKAVVGETLSATLKLYQRVNIAGFEDVKFPTFSGFWNQETFAPTNIEFSRESIDGVIYNAAVLRSWSLIPQQAGDLRIDPTELVCLVNVRTQRQSSGSIFDSFFQDDYQTIRKRVTAGAVTVHVSKLPAGAPASFSGGVGNFKMSAELSKDSLKVHDAASLKVTVSGKGNITLLDAPKISFPSDFEVYDTKSSDASGSKVFEYPFIPRSHGDFVLGPVEFTYYDVSAGKYVTLTSPEMHVSVAKGDGSSAPVESAGQLVVTPTNRKDVRDVGTDIRYIATSAPAFSRKGWTFAGSPLFWILFALIALAAAAAYFALRGVAARRADVVGTKRRGATKMARRRLSQAGDYLSKDLYTAFYEELHKALLGFVSDKLSMDATDMTKDNISEKLRSRGVSDALADEFVGLLDACEFARYSPSAGHEAMNAHFESAVSSISAIDDCMKKKHNVSAAVPVIAILLAAGLPAQAASAGADSLWTAGVQAYSDGLWSEALADWQEICDMGLESSDLYCNIGDAWYKQNELGQAVLAYERALKLDPSNATARYNLDFVNNMIQDKIETVPEFFLKQWSRKLCWLLPSGAWAALCLVLFAAVLACLLLFLLSASSSARKTGFILGVILLVFASLSLAFSLRQRADYRKVDAAVVVKPVSSAKSSPGSSSVVDLFVLHEGTKVQIIDKVGEWVNIELSDGRQGWILASDLETI